MREEGEPKLLNCRKRIHGFGGGTHVQELCRIWHPDSSELEVEFSLGREQEDPAVGISQGRGAVV